MIFRRFHLLDGVLIWDFRLINLLKLLKLDNFLVTGVFIQYAPRPFEVYFGYEITMFQ